MSVFPLVDLSQKWFVNKKLQLWPVIYIWTLLFWTLSRSILHTFTFNTVWSSSLSSFSATLSQLSQGLFHRSQFCFHWSQFRNQGNHECSSSLAESVSNFMVSGSVGSSGLKALSRCSVACSCGYKSAQHPPTHLGHRLAHSGVRPLTHSNMTASEAPT